MCDFSVPRPEHPRPQFVRDRWLNLNGKWSFEFDFGESGWDAENLDPAGVLAQGWTGASRKLAQHGLFDREILVPFCPESALSGVGHTDFIPAMFYARKITIPAGWQGKRVILHFGGVDNVTQVYIDGQFAGRHKGGQGSFEFDITPLVTPGSEQILTVHVIDHIRSGLSGVGKQSFFYKSHGCRYSRVTGIWSTVWLEAVAENGLKRCRIIPDYDNGAFVFIPEYYALPHGCTLTAIVSADGKIAGQSSAGCAEGIPFTVKLEEIREWNPDDPFLYDIRLQISDAAGNVIDEVSSYAGLRKISIVKNRLYLNNEPFFPRFVLDQGYYPQGIWTAPDDAALIRDIELGKAAGFNGARLHQKVFDERYLYHADRLGYLTWGEYGNWGLKLENPQARENFLAEWREIVQRDCNHPSIIVWCPLNETTPASPLGLARNFPYMDMLHNYRDWVTAIYDLTRALDPTRPVNDSSGFLHVKTDIWSVHVYSKDVEDMKTKMFPADRKVMFHAPECETGYNGQPYLCNEFGGFMYIPPEKRNENERWGYHGLDLATPQELGAKISEQVDFLVDDPEISGYCYTQLTDVEQEQNGIYNYDRSEKFPADIVRKIFSRKPEWSKY
ncbi:MAG: beta-glucuronidase [Lentisphaeria bacterium]|nr:beta-glucuronidase [Lentisphaeria bacterium]